MEKQGTREPRTNGAGGRGEEEFSQRDETQSLRRQVNELSSRLAAVADLERKISSSVPGLAFVYDPNTQAVLHVLGNVKGTLDTLLRNCWRWGVKFGSA